MDIKTRRLIMNGPLFTIIYTIYNYLLLTLVSNLFGGAGSYLILPLTLIISVVYLFATVVQGLYPNSFSHVLAILSEIWKGTSIYLILFTIAIYIVSWIVTVPEPVTAVILFGLVPLIALYAIYKGNKIKVNDVELYFDNLNTDLKFIHISDVHIGAIRGNWLLKNILNKINDSNQSDADFLVITGDLADGSSPITLDSFEILADSKVPIFFTPGNHDFYPGISNVLEAAKSANINILCNEMIEIKGTQLLGIPFGRYSSSEGIAKNIDYLGSVGSMNSFDSNNDEDNIANSNRNSNTNDNANGNSNNINVNANDGSNVGTNFDTNADDNDNADAGTGTNVGADADTNSNNDDVGANFKESIGIDYDVGINVDINKTSILLHHVPVGWDLFKDIGIDLVLSGHTHGGQFFPFNLFVKKVFPYLRGLYSDNGKYMYVSDGIGTLTPPMRLGTVSEMTVFHLKKKK